MPDPPCCVACLAPPVAFGQTPALSPAGPLLVAPPGEFALGGTLPGFSAHQICPLRPPLTTPGFCCSIFLLRCPPCCQLLLLYCPTVPPGPAAQLPADNCTATQSLQITLIPPPLPASPNTCMHHQSHVSPTRIHPGSWPQAGGRSSPLFDANQNVLYTAEAVRTASSERQYRQACQRGSYPMRAQQTGQGQAIQECGALSGMHVASNLGGR
jgi:hypothetical protein